MTQKYKFQFNKLVRDKIPELLQENGIIAQTRFLDQNEYIKYLKEKLVEEAKEFLEAEDKKEICEELGDISEVLLSLYEAMGISHDEVDKIRMKKNNSKGVFEQKIYCEYIEIEEDHKDLDYYLSRPDKYTRVE